MSADHDAVTCDGCGLVVHRPDSLDSWMTITPPSGSVLDACSWECAGTICMRKAWVTS